MSIPAKVSAKPDVGRQQPEPTKIGAKDAAKVGTPASGQVRKTTDFREVMGKIAKEVSEGQKTMEAEMNARRTQMMDNCELIAFQAKMYRYTHVLELTGKVVDKSTQSFKYTLQSQQ